ncbi:MAG: hypothetical protein C5B51_11895 [Terriglobia bacterium]|nr:MAG: hypothetical protein C5B51_11895 [Terriglobia bacterium]
MITALPFATALCAQNTPDMAGVLSRLDRLERQNEELLTEIRALRAELSSTQPSVPAQTAAVEQKLQIQENRIDEQAQSKVESSQRFPIRLTGMALFNAFADSRQSGGADYPTVASATGPGRAGATVRQSIVGLEFRGPEAIWGGRVHGSVYMDFFSGTAPLALTMRLRTGSIQIDWASRSVMAGIDKPIFNPREPSSLAQVGFSPLTGTGNLWLWMPQARVEQDFSFGRSSGVRARVGVVQTREFNAYAGSDPVAVEASRPGLEGRFEFFHKFDDERRLEIAPGFHTSTTHAGGDSIPSNLFSIDWFYNPVRRIEFSGAYFRGKNVVALGTGLIRQGFGFDDGFGEPVHSQGGWGQLTIHTLPRLDFHLFSGQHDDRNSDLLTGAIGKNLMFGGNLYFRIAPNVLLGWETSQLRTVYLGQGTRINNHYDLALAYLF